VLRLQRQKRSGIKITDLRSQYFVQAREALSKPTPKWHAGGYFKGREDSVTRLTVRAPMRGIVKTFRSPPSAADPAKWRDDGDCTAGRSSAD
jgi:adhesin transport system membrane fusion protein